MIGGAIRWVVRAGEEGPIGEVVARAGGDERAIAEGRVFVGRRRVKVFAQATRAGDEVMISAPNEVREKEIEILARDGDIVIVDKPAGIPTIPDQGGASHSLVALTAQVLGVDVARVHPTSRLDREVSGAVTFALSPRAAAYLARAREAGTYERRYVAIASRAPSPATGEWNALIGRARDPRHRAAALAVTTTNGALVARTLFATTAETPHAALLSLAPVTGRTHQLRVHASHAGAPLLGDRTYGGPTRMTLATGRVLALRRIALHAARVAVPLQGRSALLVATSKIPADLADLWLSLGGDPSAWDIAVSWPLQRT